jgi:acetoin utilization protein AcuC
MGLYFYNSLAKLIASYSYRGLRYTLNHPLRIPRVSLLLEFLKAMELLGDEEWVESRPAPVGGAHALS